MPSLVITHMCIENIQTIQHFTFTAVLVQLLHDNRDWNSHGCVFTSNLSFPSAMEHFSGRQQWRSAEFHLHIKIPTVRGSSHYQQLRQHLRSVQHTVPTKQPTPLLHSHPLPSPSPQWDPAETLQ